MEISELFFKVLLTKNESSTHFSEGMRGLLRDCEIFANLGIAFVSSSILLSYADRAAESKLSNTETMHVALAELNKAEIMRPVCMMQDSVSDKPCHGI